MTTVSGNLSITFSSDWQCGSGLGRHGSIDRVIVRDSDGLPYVPAKTLLGVWRDACEKAALGLDDGSPGAWAGLVRVLFGAGKGECRNPDDARGLLSVAPARLPAAWRSALGPKGGHDGTQRVFREGLTLPRYGVHIDDVSGVAKDDALRLMERARAGLTVHTEYSADLEGATWAVELLLLAGATLIHHLGSSRRRGAGRCSVAFGGNRLTSLLEEHDDTAIAAFRLTDITRVRDPRPTPSDVGPKATRVRLLTRLRFLAEQPVIAGAGVQGNVILSHGFVPGATVLPVVARALGARAQELIRHGHLVVTDANPVLAGRRGAPTPLAVQSTDKGSDWLLDGRAVNVLTNPTAGAKPIRRWSVIDGAAVAVAEVALVSRAHASIDDEAQRPLDDGLFTIEAIPPGTELEAEIWVSDQVTEVEQRSLKALKGPVTLGRYRRGDYGTVSLSHHSLPMATATDDVLTSFALALTADAYLLDAHGLAVPTADQLAQELTQRLQVTVTAGAAIVSVSRRDSWSATHALPRTTLPCLSAGSSVEFIATPGVSRAALQAVLDRGLGSRTVEGFGRATLLELPARLTATKATKATPGAPGAGPEPQDEAWTALRAESWRREINRRLRAAASQSEVRDAVIGGASNSQRGTLRRAAALLLTDSDAVLRWLSATEAHDQKAEAWGAKQLGGIRKWATGSDLREWQARLAQKVNTLDKTAAKVPDDLGGAQPTVVAATFLTECLSQKALSTKGKN